MNTKRTISTQELRNEYEEFVDNTLNNTGQRIHDLRKEHKLTLSELGEKIGVQSSAVSKWEKNRVTNIPSEKIIALAKIFGCSTDYLMFGNEDMPTMPDDIGEIIDLYSRLTPEQQKVVLNLLRSFNNESNSETA